MHTLNQRIFTDKCVNRLKKKKKIWTGIQIRPSMKEMLKIKKYICSYVTGSVRLIINRIYKSFFSEKVTVSY